jgi:hypothetical protein
MITAIQYVVRIVGEAVEVTSEALYGRTALAGGYSEQAGSYGVLDRLANYMGDARDKARAKKRSDRMKHIGHHSKVTVKSDGSIRKKRNGGSRKKKKKR